MIRQLHFFQRFQSKTRLLEKCNCLLFTFLFCAIPLLSQVSFLESAASFGMIIPSYGKDIYLIKIITNNQIITQKLLYL
ncbi:MAG: hypothetical protein P8N74_07955 [Polaribacter sp.]|nr:hypothetical protein [Polaribacter sp.]